MKNSGRKTNVSKPKPRASSVGDRAEVYVDSPLMTHRVVFKKQLFVRIQGNYGVYRTWVRTERRGLDSGCTCPSDWEPCKHVRALKLTWRQSPESFFDVDGFVKTLAIRPKSELIDTIGKLIARAPEGLAALGVKGFEEGDDEEGEEDGEW